MIGERGVAAILGVAPRHVAAQAVGILCRVRGGKISHVASETFGPVIGNRLRRFCVWVVAGATPQAALAVARARAQGELFHVADHLEIASGSSRRCGIVVDRECVFKRLARDKIAQLFAGIRHAARAKQVALFADAVARGRRQLCGIHDIAGAWIGKVAFCWAVAPFTGDRFRGKNRRSVGIQRPRNVKRFAGMAKQALFGDGPREIRVGSIFVARRKIVRIARFVIGDRRLKQVTVNFDQISAGMIPRADDVTDRIARLIAAIFPGLERSGF